jgi:hypothetical protein
MQTFHEKIFIDELKRSTFHILELCPGIILERPKMQACYTFIISSYDKVFCLFI